MRREDLSGESRVESGASSNACPESQRHQALGDCRFPGIPCRRERAGGPSPLIVFLSVAGGRLLLVVGTVGAAWHADRRGLLRRLLKKSE